MTAWGGGGGGEGGGGAFLLVFTRRAGAGIFLSLELLLILWMG